MYACVFVCVCSISSLHTDIVTIHTRLPACEHQNINTHVLNICGYVDKMCDVVWCQQPPRPLNISQPNCPIHMLAFSPAAPLPPRCREPVVATSRISHIFPALNWFVFASGVSDYTVHTEHIWLYVSHMQASPAHIFHRHWTIYPRVCLRLSMHVCGGNAIRAFRTYVDPYWFILLLDNYITGHALMMLGIARMHNVGR